MNTINKAVLVFCIIGSLACKGSNIFDSVHELETEEVKARKERLTEEDRSFMQQLCDYADDVNYNGVITDEIFDAMDTVAFMARAEVAKDKAEKKISALKKKRKDIKQGRAVDQLSEQEHKELQLAEIKLMRERHIKSKAKSCINEFNRIKKETGATSQEIRDCFSFGLSWVYFKQEGLR